MKLSEWNEILSYAKELCSKANADLRPIVYTMYDGRKGINLTLFDDEGSIFKAMASGVYDTVGEYKRALYAQYGLISSFF